MVSHNNGHARRQPQQPTGFPEGYRRLVPGEVTQEGDLCRDCSQQGTEWAPVEPGIMYFALGEDRRAFACPADRPVPDHVYRRALVRLLLWCIENLYTIEQLATAGNTAGCCHACGGVGEPDEQMLFTIVEGLIRDGELMSNEQAMLEEAELDSSQADYVEVYEIIRGHREATKSSRLPAIPMIYYHEPDCPAWNAHLVISGVADVGHVAAQNTEEHETASQYEPWI